MSRLTFRDKVEVCHQYTTRLKAAQDKDISRIFPEPSGPISIKRAQVRPIGRALAWKVISRYEWLGTLPGCSHFYGIFFDNHCGGVACFSVGWVGAGINVPGWMGADAKQIAYLSRGACVHWAPKGTAPKLINRASLMTGCEVAIAYADTDAGEIGTVYQAAGWTCLGKGASVPQYVSPQGRAYDGKLPYNMVLKKRGLTWIMARDALMDAGWKEQKSNPKWRYAKLLPSGKSNPTLLNRFEVSATAYPKRDLRQPLREPGSQSGNDGSIPILALHLPGDP